MNPRPTERLALFMCVIASLGIIGAIALTLHVGLPLCGG